MARKVWAFLAFNYYSFWLIDAFGTNMAFLYGGEPISLWRSLSLGVIHDSAGWAEHYIIRLVAAMVTTAAAGFLAGAIAQHRGGRTAAAQSGQNEHLFRTNLNSDSISI